MVPACCERVLHSSIDALRDGGLHGWIAVLGLFSTKVAGCILLKGLGMMLPTLQEQFVTSTWLIGWMVAFVNAGAHFSGPAIGISFVITKHLIGCYFSKSITTAYGVAALGNSFVFVAVVPLIQLFLDIYGWRGTMLLLGGLLVHLAVFGALIKPPDASWSRDGYEAAHTDDEQETKDDEVVPTHRFGCSCFTTFYSFLRDTFRLGLFSSISFWLVVILVSIWTMTNTAWVIYYVQYSTVYKGFTLGDASRFIIAYGIGRAVACVVIGPLVQTVQFVSTHTWLAITSLVLTFYYAIDPWLISYWLIIGNTFLFGNAISMTSILFDVVIKETFGKDQMGHVFGWNGMASGSTLLLLLYFPGLIYDTIGDYTVTFSVMAGAESLTVFAVLWLYWKQKSHCSSTGSSQ